MKPNMKRRLYGLDHICRADGCAAFGCYGFHSPGVERWYCPAHEAEGEAAAARARGRPSALAASAGQAAAQPALDLAGARP